MNGTSAARMPTNFQRLRIELNAPTTDSLVRRPSAVSSNSSDTPIVNARMKYVTMKVPPPYLAASVGNLHRLPSPTALAAPARMNPILPDHAERSTCLVCCAMFSPCIIKGPSKALR